MLVVLEMTVFIASDSIILRPSGIFLECYLLWYASSLDKLKNNSLMATRSTVGNMSIFPCYSSGNSLKPKNITSQCNYFNALL